MLEDWSGGWVICFSLHWYGGDAMSGLTGGFNGFVGIDVSKDKFDVCGLTSESAKLLQFSATMDRKAFDKLKGHLAAFAISSVLIGMESTGPTILISSRTWFLKVTTL
jgi:hypothetical protein